MDNMQRGGLRKGLSLLILFVPFLTISQHPSCINAAPQEEYPLQNQGYSDQSSESKNKFISSLKNLLDMDEEGKRSSSFFPLRGKKMSSIDDSTNNDYYQFMPEQEDKRGQFYALRGKKIPSELKRASSFMPMRGRKNDEWDMADESEDKRASSFMPMRGKKKSGNSYQQFGKPGTYPSIKNELTFPSSSDSSKIPAKRMSSFIPVRGKKSDFQIISTNYSRANRLSDPENITSSEHLRNKRSTYSMPERELLSDSTGQFQFPENGSPGEIVTTMLEKKHNSFKPIRERRISYFALKRPMSFFATRGKRMDSSSIDD